LKIPELHAKTDERVGMILCPPEWFTYDANLRIELLSDWIYGLERIRDATAVQMNADDAIRKAMKK
jgi:hypothetical protein